MQLTRINSSTSPEYRAALSAAGVSHEAVKAAARLYATPGAQG